MAPKRGREAENAEVPRLLSADLQCRADRQKRRVFEISPFPVEGLRLLLAFSENVKSVHDLVCVPVESDISLVLPDQVRDWETDVAA